MTKLCPRGKAAAKRKFAVYPSAYANAYASKICAGKIKDPSGTKRKDFIGPKPAGKAMGGRIGFSEGSPKLTRDGFKMKEIFKKEKFRSLKNKKVDPKTSKEYQGLRGGGVCLRGMNREAVGKNS